MFNRFGPVIILVMLFGCSSPSTVKFLSTPEDAVVSMVEDNGTAVVLGKTPLQSSEVDVYKGSGRHSQILIKKENYKAHEIVLMRPPSGGSETIVNVQLVRDEVNQNAADQTVTQEKIANAIARANGMIQSKQYSEAEAVLSNFVEQYPSVSVGYDYLGNLNYLQKRFAKALKYYKKALALNPQNTERKNIVEKLESITKNDSRAGDAQ